MAYKYGINSKVIKGDAQSPVTTSSCVVIVGLLEATGSYNSGHWIECKSMTDFQSMFYTGKKAPSNYFTMAVEYALKNIDRCYALGIKPGDSMDIRAKLNEIILQTADVPNIIIEASSSVIELPEDMTLIDGYKCQVFTCVEESGDQVDWETSRIILDALTEKVKRVPWNVACWGDCLLLDGSHVAVSTLAGIARAVEDSKNTNNVPYRSVGNIRVNIDRFYIDGDEYNFSASDLEGLTMNGIVSIVNKGNHRYYTWGDYTAAVENDEVDDETNRFDSTIAVIYHICNRFIKKWHSIIDSPMSLRLRDCIIAEEQDYLNSLVAIGALIGSPKCVFKPNSADTLGKGHFYFTNIVTPTIPAKYIELQLQYTDEGLQAYLA